MSGHYVTLLIHAAFAICCYFRYPWEIYVVLKLSEAIQGRHILAASRIMNIIPSVIASNLTRTSACASQNSLSHQFCAHNLWEAPLRNPLASPSLPASHSPRDFNIAANQCQDQSGSFTTHRIHYASSPSANLLVLFASAKP